jgi:transcriptional regulator with XRE-family HTH domain
MDQQKTGGFLKDLRKEKGLTQEQLAEHFCVSSRTVSRWETGSNLPTLDMLIELADFYNVDIREIIDGERKSENMDHETKDTLKKVAAYATEEQRKLNNRVHATSLWIAVIMLICCVLFSRETKGLLNGIVPESVCSIIMAVTLVIGVLTVSFLLLYDRGGLDRYIEQKLLRK